MAVTIQYSSDLDSIVTARDTGARAPIGPGNHRGVVRHSSAIVTLTADLDYVGATDYDILGFFELVPNIRIISAQLKTSAGVGDVDLIAYDPADPLDTTKHVTLVEGLEDVSAADSNSVGDILTQQQAQWPFNTDNYKTKLVQGTAGTGEIDISAACPVPDGVSGINHGRLGIGLAAGTGLQQLSSGEIVELSILYSHE